MSSNLVPVNIDFFRPGEPLPFPLFDEDGVLLAQKNFVIRSPGELALLAERGLYINVSDSDYYRRAYLERLNELVLKDKTLGQIAGAQFSRAELEAPRNNTAEVSGPADWLNYQTQASSILRDVSSAHFLPRLVHLQKQLRQQIRSNPDSALFALFHLSASELRLYSATHAMLVCVMCSLAAREVLSWSEEQDQVLCLAALTMNLSMTEMQDRLAQQLSPPTPEQRKQIEQHPTSSVEILKQVGVSDLAWLEAVQHHHDVLAGPLANRSDGMRMARLIQRADMFAARLAPRAARVPISPAAAMQASYFDENRKVDEAGAALIKTVGIYSPGSYVRLNTNEIAIVVSRGVNTTTPRVAVLVNRSGMPMAEPVIRDTGLRDFRVVASVPHRDVKIQLNLQRMLTLTSPT